MNSNVFFLFLSEQLKKWIKSVAKNSVVIETALFYSGLIIVYSLMSTLIT